VSGTQVNPTVLARARVELLDGSLPRQPYHAIAEEGAPRSIIGKVEAAARAAVVTALQSFEKPDVVAVIAAPRQIPDELDRILASHMLLHSAEGDLYEQAVIDAMTSLGLATEAIPPQSIQISDAVDRLGRDVGPPWQKDHKLATAAALAALGAR